MSESKVIWHSIEKEGLPPDDCDSMKNRKEAILRQKDGLHESRLILMS